MLRKEVPTKDTIKSLINSITGDPFYGVSIQSARTIGFYSTSKKICEEIKSYIYDAIKSLLDENKTNSILSILDPRIIPSILSAFSQYTKYHNKKSLDLVKQYINNTNWFIAQSAIAAFGKIASTLTVKGNNENKNNDSEITEQEQKDIIEYLKNIVNSERNQSEMYKKSFQRLLARGAISGLQNFAEDKEERLIVDIAKFVISYSGIGNDYLIRQASIVALGYFLRYKIKEEDKEIEKFNSEVFDQLDSVTKSSRFGLQTTACQALVNKLPENPDNDIIKILNTLTWVAEHDPDGIVRREAESSINQIRTMMKEWLEQPIQLESKICQQRKELHEKIMEVRLNRLNIY